MRDPAELFAQLKKSKFRCRFRLKPEDQAYLKRKTTAVVLQHGRRFLLQRLAPAEPPDDGRQTPMRGHPIFIAHMPPPAAAAVAWQSGTKSLKIAP